MARLYMDKTGAAGIVANHDRKANVQAYMNSTEVFGVKDISDALRLHIAYKLRSKELIEEYTVL